MTLTSTARASRTISESFDARFAASSRSDDARIFRPESCISLFASSIFVPAVVTSKTDKVTVVLINRLHVVVVGSWHRQTIYRRYTLHFHSTSLQSCTSINGIPRFLIRKARDSRGPIMIFINHDRLHMSSLFMKYKVLCSKTSMFAVQGSLVKLMAKTLDTRTERTTSTHLRV